MLAQKIGFIGAGQMARALGKGFVSAGLLKPAQILATDPVAAAVAEMAALVPGMQSVAGSQVSSSNAALAAQADVIFLAVKPQNIPEVLAEIRPAVTGGKKLVVSIAAGVSLATMAEGLASKRLVRVMPNTPCLVGQSASGFAALDGATAEDAALVEQLLSAVGRAYRLEEKHLDAVTGLSGSGPAYVYVMIEALSDGGVRMGLPRAIATALAAQTVLGSAQMVLETGDHPGVLKDRVASPGGTTIAGLAALEAAGFRSALISAVEAATKRSMELGKK